MQIRLSPRSSRGLLKPATNSSGQKHHCPGSRTYILNRGSGVFEAGLFGGFLRSIIKIAMRKENYANKNMAGYLMLHCRQEDTDWGQLMGSPGLGHKWDEKLCRWQISISSIDLFVSEGDIHRWWSGMLLLSSAQLFRTWVCAWLRLLRAVREHLLLWMAIENGSRLKFSSFRG